MNGKNRFQPTLGQLRAFSAAYRLRKLSAAADSLNITQSAVSVSIKQLEEGLGVRLFDRTTRSLHITPAAQDAIVLADRILRDVEALRNKQLELVDLHRGRISIAVTPTLAENLLPKVIQTFCQQHPGVKVVIEDCAPDQFLPRILSQQVDFGIGTPENQAGTDIEKETLVRDQLSAIVPKTHPLAQRKAIHWRDLEGHPISTMRHGYGVRHMIETTAAKEGVKLQVANEVAFLSTALWMASCNMGVAVMPAAYVKFARDPELVALPLNSPKVTRDISIVTPAGRSLSHAARVFLEVLKAASA
jgi:DNA-binding transcriptional LysR family regulator